MFRMLIAKQSTLMSCCKLDLLGDIRDVVKVFYSKFSVGWNLLEWVLLNRGKRLLS